MNTPPKVKLYTERTRAKDRTAKNRKGRNGRTQSSDLATELRHLRGNGNIGERHSPNHQARAITKEGLDAIFTRSDVFLTVPAVDEAHVPADEPKNRAERRLKARRTVLNTLFRAGKKD